MIIFLSVMQEFSISSLEFSTIGKKFLVICHYLSTEFNVRAPLTYFCKNALSTETSKMFVRVDFNVE